MTTLQTPDPAATPPPYVFKRFPDACREARKRRKTDLEAGLFTRVEPFPYGEGFVLRTVPIESLQHFPAKPFPIPGVFYPSR